MFKSVLWWPSIVRCWINYRLRGWMLHRQELSVSWHQRTWCLGAQQINSLRPSDAMLRHKSVKILAQAMTYFLIAPNYCFNQNWLTINEVLWHSFQGNVYLNKNISIPKLCLKCTHLKSHSHLPMANELNIHTSHHKRCMRCVSFLRGANACRVKW